MLEKMFGQQDELKEQVQKQQDVLKERVSEYKKAHPDTLPECDFAFLLKTLDRLNEACRVKAAKNAFNEKREWIPGTETWNIGGVYLDEERCVTFSLRREGEAITIAQLFEQLVPIMKKLPMRHVPIKLRLGEERFVKITDVYAHSLVSSQWAGMPVDLVLCYTQKKES